MVEFGEPEIDFWYAISWGGGNVTVEDGQIMYHRVFTFNYKEGTKTITFSDVQETVKTAASGSDMDCLTAPRKRHENQLVFVPFS